jgi:hypothetical protein
MGRVDVVLNQLPLGTNVTISIGARPTQAMRYGRTLTLDVSSLYKTHPFSLSSVQFSASTTQKSLLSSVPWLSSAATTTSLAETPMSPLKLTGNELVVEDFTFMIPEGTSNLSGFVQGQPGVFGFVNATLSWRGWNVNMSNTSVVVASNGIFFDFGETVNAIDGVANLGDTLIVTVTCYVSPAAILGFGLRDSTTFTYSRLVYDAIYAESYVYNTIVAPLLAADDPLQPHSYDALDLPLYVLRLQHAAVTSTSAFRVRATYTLSPSLFLSPSSVVACIFPGTQLASWQVSTASCFLAGGIIISSSIAPGNPAIVFSFDQLPVGWTMQASLNANVSQFVEPGQTLVSLTDVQYFMMPDDLSLAPSTTPLSFSTSTVITMPTLSFADLGSSDGVTSGLRYTIMEIGCIEVRVQLPEMVSVVATTITLPSNTSVVNASIRSIGSSLFQNNLVVGQSFDGNFYVLSNAAGVQQVIIYFGNTTNLADNVANESDAFRVS